MPHQKCYMSQEYTEEDVQKALSELRDGVHKNAAAATQAHNIPPRTLRWHVSMQLLTPAQLKAVLEEHDIPWENVYNMDEKGSQLGGGCKGQRQKYLFGHNSREQYHVHDANLELVTVVECPYIIFKGKQLRHSWFEASGAEHAAGQVMSVLPLNMGIFGPFQTTFADKVDTYIKEHNHGLSKMNFVTIYLDACDKAFVSSTIHKAFCKCGINPFNPDVFSEVDFALSQATSTIGSSHLPTTFPGSEEWDHESAGKDTNSDVDDDTELPSNSHEHNDTPTNLSTFTSLATSHIPISIPHNITTRLSKKNLVAIACELHDHNTEAQAAVEMANAHAIILGHQYMEL
ncbi:hypothetical protein BS47DRAFT_1453840 [Hydnum rufescens UP504]|uniref:Uncharacterized protein n=1 Tax=Hydnum rufescens UP504 TaxID=1448309 RepID=A0A9P6ABM5_9AGAM|nr:hypothetical protein BS47DRAFT_1453840 [Hydnum rufescens UP504]